MSEPTWPCMRCTRPMTRAEGGTVFTLCEECWDEGREQRGARTGSQEAVDACIDAALRAP